MHRIAWMFLFCMLTASVALAQVPPVNGPDEPEPAPPAAEPVPTAKPVPPVADDDSVLRDLQKQIDELRREVERLQNAPSTPQPGMLSLRNDWLRVGGELELEYIETQNESQHIGGNTDNPESRFEIDKFDIRFEITYNSRLDAYAEFESDFDDAFMDEAWVRVGKLWLDAELKAGLQPYFFAPKRRTESYPMMGRMIWEQEYLGLSMEGPLGDHLRWYGFVGNGTALDTKAVTEDDSFHIIVDDKKSGDSSTHKQFGGGLAFTFDWLGGEAELMGFATSDILDDSEIVFLQSVTGYGASTDDDRLRVGGGVKWNYDTFEFLGQYFDAQDGDLERDGFFAEVSNHWDLPSWTGAKKMMLLYRYGMYDVSNLERVEADPFTWDRNLHTGAMRFWLHDHVTLRIEYYVHEEDTAGAEPSNDEGLVQLDVAF
jgi:hypothetical protein